MSALNPSPIIQMPQLCLVDELESALPLEHTRVTVQITGPLALVVVNQRFGNPLEERADLEYLFPLPFDAAITGFEIQIGERHIQGNLQERETARASYEEARSAGKRAGLFEQRRENLYSVRLANVQPAETVQATLRYQQQLKYEEDARGGIYAFVFPMGITPKYDSPSHPEEGEGVHAPVAHGEKVGPVEIALTADAGFAVREVSSPSHPIETLWLDHACAPDAPARRFQVRLQGEQIPDRDFVLRYMPDTAQACLAGWTSGAPGDGRRNAQDYFMASIVPPLMQEDAQVPPRDFIFVLDRSGSMSGEPIKQARNALRACLRVLNPEDTFAILLFDNDLEWFQKEPAAVTQQQVEQADAYLKRVEGRGGTEIVSAIEAALALPANAQRARYILFLTDGAVSAEARVLEGIRAKIGQARLFTFGIGPSVNRALLSRMAALGRGQASFLQLDEDIEGAIIRFQDSVSFPAMTDLSLKVEGGKVWDVYPARLPDLYHGQPLEIRGRLARARRGTLRLTVDAMRAGQPVRMTLDLPAPTGQDRAIERLWAQSRVEDLTEQMALEPRNAEKLRAEILDLAKEYNLATALTSFVAVDHTVDAISGKARVIHVAQPLPHGLNPMAFSPSGATPPMPASSLGAPGSLPPNLKQNRVVRGQYQLGSAGVMRGLVAMSTGAPSSADETIADLPQSGGEAVLRWLARTQNLNGSWQEDVEWTAAALLAFIRSGQTTRSGVYRQIVRRAAQWLRDNTSQDLPEVARVAALNELSDATGGTQKLVPLQEAAIQEQTENPPEAIHSLEDLRQAALLRKKMAVPPELLQGPDAGLANIWAAALQA